MNLLLTGAFDWENSEIQRLKEMGNNIVYLQQEQDILPCSYDFVEGIVGNGIFLYHSIEKFVNLKYIQLTSAGFDRVPLEYVYAHNIEIHNARGVYSVPMAEFAISGVLQIYKKTEFFINNQKEHKWLKNRELLELYGKTVCIVGCGSVGTECAKRFKVFGCEVVGIDIKPYSNENYDRMYNLFDLKVSLKNSDIVILTLPLTEQTVHLFNRDMFESVKNGSVFVNMSRGLIVETESLINALKTKLLGACIDVFEEEPLNENCELWDLKNVIITPHNSFIGDGNHDRMIKEIFRWMKQ